MRRVDSKMNRLRHSLLASGAIIVWLILALSACAPVPDTAGTTPLPAATEEPAVTPAPVTEGPVATPARTSAVPTSGPTEGTDVTEREIRLTLPVRASPERVEISTPDPVVGEVPEELLAAILEDAEARVETADEEFAVLRAEAITWSDGSLGCPQPGMMYTQALVEGYWVVLEVGGEQFDYRAAASGYFTLCEQGLPRPVTTPGSDTGKPSE